MASEDSGIDSNQIPLSGIPLAKRFYELAEEEYQSGDTERMREGCEKAYRAAMEALDVLLSIKGYRIDFGQPEAHGQRSGALSDLVDIDPKMRRIEQEYSTFAQVLHGAGFYSKEDPTKFARQFKEVRQFIETIEELLNKQ